MSQETLFIYRNLIVEHLLDDELEYELAIRRETFSSGDTRAAKVRKLRNALKLQREINNFEVYELEKNMLDVEYKQIEQKIEAIRDMLENRRIKKKSDLSPYKTRLIHLVYRSLRLKETGMETLGLERIALQLYNNFFTMISTDPDAVKNTEERLLQDISFLQMNNAENNNLEDRKQTTESSEEDQTIATKVRKSNIPKLVKKSRKRKSLDCEKMLQLILNQVDKHLERRLSSLNISIPTTVETSQKTVNKNTNHVHENSKESAEQIRPLKNKKMKNKINLSSISSESDRYSSSEQLKPSSYQRESSSTNSESEYGNKTLKRHPRPVADWKLKYDGKDDGKLLNKFITEVEFMAQAEKLTKKDLFDEAIHLFSGDVRSWYIEGRKNKDFRNWTELVSEIKLEYQMPDLDFHYEQQAALRRQKRSEKFTDYYKAIKEIFSYMSVQPSEEP